MANEKSKAVTCPNCAGPAIRSGDEIACEQCNAIYEIKKKPAGEEKKVKSLGIEDRLTKIESRLFGDKGEQKPDESEAESEDDL